LPFYFLLTKRGALNPTKIGFKASFIMVMKNILSLAIILLSVCSLFAQTTPLTQAEYVKMLYEVQKMPAKKQTLIETVRKRGIGFVLTDGLKGLTRSKTGNDLELVKTLEESDRRRQNPNDAKLPDAKESAETLEKTRQNTLLAIEEMPDFVAKQLIGRSVSYAGTTNFTPIDQLVIAVSFSTEKGEQYRVLMNKGVAVNAQTGSNYGGLDGATTGGEFVEDLQRIFKPESKTTFNLIDTSVVRGRKAIVYEYRISIENNKNDGITSKGSNSLSVPIGRIGKIYIDRELNRILRTEFQATDIPRSFPIKKFESTTDYDWAEIGGEKYLLPLQSDARFTASGDGELYQSKNFIRFKNYQKFGTEVKVLDDDVVEEPKQP
jgi:hypothetical protein